MLRTLFQFALPGGRRVVVAYFPPKAEDKTPQRRIPEVAPPEYDRIFAQAGLYAPSVPFDLPKSARPKRTR